MEEIRYEVASGVATLTIDRPAKKGAMTYAMLAEFTDRIDAAGADPEVGVLLVTGVPGSFCAGIDLADLASRSPDDRGGGRQRGVPALMECPKPVVCAVDGMAVGMGAEFATQADIRLVSPRARFRWNFVHRGLVSDTGAGTWLLPRQIGTPAALWLLYTGDDLGADEAVATGFAAGVHPSEELGKAARELAERIATASPFALSRTKQLVLSGAGTTMADHVGATRDALTECFASEDHAEGVAAFLQRRPARFTGR
ncbi:enoyl-CoA hydratase/isomerase family protein [Pseudonocardia pini]|uniref:enoyl-CoA hydratase/isomerase family protein n=1 Tax=Pseudonocardia pini TaxID=2758030 RepID=UPI0015F10B44|nr:enoyl-CoA hydratase/isomerase family protein [Pseudonocardia pini]